MSRRRDKTDSVGLFVWTRSHTPGGRKGQRCSIVRRKGLPSPVVEVEFADGARFIVDSRGLRRV